MPSGLVNGPEGFVSLNPSVLPVTIGGPGRSTTLHTQDALVAYLPTRGRPNVLSTGDRDFYAASDVERDGGGKLSGETVALTLALYLSDSGAALGNQLCTVPSRRDRRLSCSVPGVGSPRSPSRWLVMRSSTLPRLTAAATNSRSTGSRARISSGRRSDKSRNRPFTERSSALTKDPAAAVVAAPPSPCRAAPALALAYPVML